MIERRTYMRIYACIYAYYSRVINHVSYKIHATVFACVLTVVCACVANTPLLLDWLGK